MTREELQSIEAIIPWRIAQDYISYYKLNQALKYPGNSTNSIESFYFPHGVMQKIIDSGAHRIFFAFAYHTDQTMFGASRPGHTIVAFGMKVTGTGNDEVRELMLGDNHIVWNSIIADDYQITNKNMSIKDVRTVVQSYNSSHKVQTTHHKVGTSTIYDLKGSSFPISELEVLCHQSYGATKIECSLAYHINPTNRTAQTGHTFIMLGNKNNTRLNDDSLHNVYDYCDPCPRKCPINYSAIS